MKEKEIERKKKERQKTTVMYTLMGVKEIKPNSRRFGGDLAL